jgi:tetratricopeptide (TPR) repeat protein
VLLFCDDRIDRSSGKLAMPESDAAKLELRNQAAAEMQAMFMQGLALHQQGKLADAERIYMEILQQQPLHFGALHLAGLIACQTRRTERGAAMIAKAISLNANIVTAHNDLGNALLDLKRAEQAVASFDRAIALQPDNAEAYNNRGIALKDLKRVEEALASYNRAIGYRPDYAEAYNNRGNVLLDLKRTEEALASFDKAIALQPNFPEAHNNRSNALLDLERAEEALASVDKAIALKPDFAQAYNARGDALLGLERPAEALESYDKALKLQSDLAEAWLGRGSVFRELKRDGEALAAYDKALALKPDLAEAWLGRGYALAELKRYDAALASYDKALALKPDLVGAWLRRGNVFAGLNRYDDAFAAYDKALALEPDLAGVWLGRGNVFCDLKRYDEANVAFDKALALKPDLEGAWLGRGNVFFSMNRDEEALTCFDKAIALGKDLAEGYWNKSLLKLSLGEYEVGWQLYEWRWKYRLFTSPGRNFSQPLWLGIDSIVGKTILIHSEQGFGDTIQFFRYLSKLEKLGPTIIIETQTQLVPLIKAQRGNCQIIGQGETLPSFDVHCPLLSLPLAFKTTLETIPAQVPYLFAPPEKLELWRTKLGTKRKSRIGLVWSGKLSPDFRRSVPLESLLLIIDEKAEWYSLQKDVRESDRSTLNSSLTIIDHSPSLNDFSDTAALITEMDLVISIDTAVAHLAGALGKPVWILLPFHPDFRWLRDREDSPWYPTARLFRQTQDGDWSDVIDRVFQELKIFFDPKLNPEFEYRTNIL